MARQTSVKIEGVPELAKRIERWDKSMSKNLKDALTQIGNAWVMQAKRRVPVSGGGNNNTIPGRLRNSINKNVEVTNTKFELAVGTNVRYGVFVEFGTKHIAGGAVKALGTSPEITDARAVKTWPALEARGGSNQQMPWLRPAWMSIKQKAIKMLNDVLKPPRK